MTKRLRTAVISDSHPTIEGYAAISNALLHAGALLEVEVESRWLPTSQLGGDVALDLEGFDALWCGPWGPYRNSDAALSAIRFARERQLPFFGTSAAC